MAWLRDRRIGLCYHDSTKASRAYTLYASVFGSHANLVSPDGEIVHRWYHPLGVQYAHLLDNGNLFVRTGPPAEADGAQNIGGSTGALLELDWEGNVVWEYHNPLLHHDSHVLENGNLLNLIWRKLPPKVHDQVQGGHQHDEDPELMWGDVVQEISREGSIVSEWRSWEHLSFAKDRICPLESHKEWTHANAIDRHADGRWLISFRLIDTIATIDPKTGKFLWKWGPGTLSHQHDAHWLENGNILIFDNGTHRRRGPSYSRVIELDPGTEEIVWQYQAPTILAFYSFMVGSARRMPNGNTFICEGATGRLFEVTPEGETVWEFVTPFMYPSRFGHTPAIFRAHRYLESDPRVRIDSINPDTHAELRTRIERDGVQLEAGKDPRVNAP
ncbi:MAG: aryl-sulfate sulfotransferase [Gammaproteobacteria bacterium]|nr:aryl-sulfate sulfotransferase [Gammaproteobacteria bacterium]